MELNIKNKIESDIEHLPFELVERKGVGHPDTICDAIAETASRYYSLYCFEKYGRVAHHWFDKVLLIIDNMHKLSTSSTSTSTRMKISVM